MDKHDEISITTNNLLNDVVVFNNYYKKVVQKTAGLVAKL